MTDSPNEGLEHPRNKKSSEYYSVGLNTEIIIAIIALSISFFWFVLSLFILRNINFYNFFVFGIGVILLIIGVIKRRKQKHNNLDF